MKPPRTPDSILPSHRAVLHVDMDAFYASVEQLDHPEYRGKPVIVGGSVENRGVVSAASYESRKFGVRSAMPMFQARKLCPHGVFLPVRGRRYGEISRSIREVFLDYTPLVEPLSLDEAYLDVTASRTLFGPPEKIGREIKERIKMEIGLTASVGIAPNKFLAKIASDLEKPDGFVIVPEDIVGFLAPLPIERLWGVGRKTAEALHKKGLRKVADIQNLGRERVAAIFGPWGEALHSLSLGRNDSPVIPDTDAKSISNEATFPVDLTDLEEIRARLLGLAERVGGRMRKAGYYGTTIQLKVRFPSFKTVTRDETLSFPTQSDRILYETGLRLLARANPSRLPIRLLGIGAVGLTRTLVGAQLRLFDEEDPRDSSVDAVVDAVREKFGAAEIRRGRMMK